MVYHMLIHFEHHVEQTQHCTILLDAPFVGLAKVTSSSHRKDPKAEPGCGSDPVADLETKGLLDEKTGAASSAFVEMGVSENSVPHCTQWFC